MLTLASDSTNLFAGGFFTSVGGVDRHNLAALDLDTGRATDWAPKANNAVKTLAIRSNVVFAGGTFTEMNGEQRAFLAAVDLINGANLALDADIQRFTPNSEVSTILSAPDKIIVGGLFTNFFNLPQKHIGALNPETFQPITNWTPQVDNRVTLLAYQGDMLYVAGTFRRINGQPRRDIGALRLADGELRAWNIPVDAFGSFESGVLSFSFGKDRMYMGGTFWGSGGLLTNSPLVVDPIEGRRLTWDHEIVPPVSRGSRPVVELAHQANGVVFTAIYHGGFIYAINVFNESDGRRLPWTIEYNHRFKKIQLIDGLLFVCSDSFLGSNGTEPVSSRGIAAFAFPQFGSSSRDQGVAFELPKSASYTSLVETSEDLRTWRAYEGSASTDEFLRDPEYLEQGARFFRIRAQIRPGSNPETPGQ